MDYSKFGFRKGFDPNNRFKKQERIEFEGHIYQVSTVDLGLDHGFDGQPLYYETMIFQDNGMGKFQQRYSTKEEAIQGHKTLVADILNGKYAIVDGYFEKQTRAVNTDLSKN